MISDNLWLGTRVRLTGLTKEDLPQVARWFRDAGLLRLWNADAAKPVSEADLLKHLEELDKKQNAFGFAIRPLEGDTLLGYVELDDILWSHQAGWLAIGIGDRANWGQGYGHEAMTLVLDFAFRELNLHRVQLTVFEYNERAIALYEKLGFRREGVFREMLHRDGRRYDMYLYGLLRREWEAGSAAASGLIRTVNPLILLTNDDGLDSPGLLAAAHAVADLGELLIVAPAQQQTGMGRGIPPPISDVLVEKLLSVGGRSVPAFGLPGAPALAVLYGVLALASRRPDLVISGINYGENLGTSVTASGTVGAALQAAELGIPALAISLETDPAYHFHHGEDVDWRAAAHFAHLFSKAMLHAELLHDVDVIKVDVPCDATPQTSWRMTRQSRQPYYETLPPAAPPPRGKLIRLDYRVNIEWETLERDSDIWAFAADRVVSVTPLSHDLTARADFELLAQRLRGSG